MALPGTARFGRSVLPVATGRWPRPHRWPGNAVCRWSWCRPGTLNHFARDVGVYDLLEATDAVQAGEAVAVDLGVVDIHSAGREPPPAAS